MHVYMERWGLVPPCYFKWSEANLNSWAISILLKLLGRGKGRTIRARSLALACWAGPGGANGRAHGSRIRPESTEFHRNSSNSAQPETKPNRSKYFGPIQISSPFYGPTTAHEGFSIGVTLKTYSRCLAFLQAAASSFVSYLRRLRRCTARAMATSLRPSLHHVHSSTPPTCHVRSLTVAVASSLHQIRLCCHIHPCCNHRIIAALPATCVFPVSAAWTLYEPTAIPDSLGKFSSNLLKIHWNFDWIPVRIFRISEFCPIRWAPNFLRKESQNLDLSVWLQIFIAPKGEVA